MGMEKAEVYYRRALYHVMEPYFRRKEIVGLRGPRQTGKTTLLKKIQAQFSGEGFETHFVNLDNYRSAKIFAEDPLAIIGRYKTQDEPLYLFIDEIQKAENGGESLKLIYDEHPDVKIFFTGSSSLEIKENILPPLVGRVILFELHSFDFGEFLAAHDPGLARVLEERRVGCTELLNSTEDQQIIQQIKDLKPPVFGDDIGKLLDNYLIWGGYPEMVKDLVFEHGTQRKAEVGAEVRRVVLQNTIGIYLEKDIKVHFNIGHFDAYIGLTKILGSAIGGGVVPAVIASNLRISEPTVNKYLAILEHSYIIKLLRPYHKNIRTELRKQRKCFFMDNGMRNALLDQLSPFDSRGDVERGFLLENFVFRQLYSRYVANYNGWKLSHWRTKGGAEVDFVLSKGNSVIPIEVKSGGKKLSRGYYSFLDTYKPNMGLVATLNTFRIEEKGGIPIIWLPAYYL